VTPFVAFAPPAEAGFRLVAGRPDGLQRLMVVGGRLLASESAGPVHAHAGDEVIRVLEGELLVRVGDERRTCRPGDLAIVPPRVLHGFQVPRRRGGGRDPALGRPRGLSAPRTSPGW
jgi:mannose-6-phosphate isomerase-like protein (cupin superfamily)